MLKQNTGLSPIQKNLHFFSGNLQYFETFCVYNIIEAVKKIASQSVSKEKK